MSKNCGHTVPCGCKDIPLTTGAPCNDGIECEGNPCAENFCAECIIWCGDGLPQLGIETGMTLQHVIQRIEVALAPILPHNCAEITDPPSFLRKLDLILFFLIGNSILVQPISV